MNLNIASTVSLLLIIFFAVPVSSSSLPAHDETAAFTGVGYTMVSKQANGE